MFWTAPGLPAMADSIRRNLYAAFMSWGRHAVSNLYLDLAILTATQPAVGRWRLSMLDAVMLAIGGAFLVVAVLYTIACDRI
jgi:hypothetical protein